MNHLVPNHFHERDDVPVVIVLLVIRLIESCKVPRGERGFILLEVCCLRFVLEEMSVAIF